VSDLASSGRLWTVPKVNAYLQIFTTIQLCLMLFMRLIVLCTTVNLRQRVSLASLFGSVYRAKLRILLCSRFVICTVLRRRS